MLVINKKKIKFIRFIGIVVFSALWLTACGNKEPTTIEGKAPSEGTSGVKREGPPGSVTPAPPPPYVE